jgi:transketolase
MDLSQLKDTATQIRRDIVRMVHACQSGHPGGSLGCADLFTALYFKVLKHKKRFNMLGKNEDLFFLSNGHISPVWYSALARSGYFPVSELTTFRKLNTRLQGHPTTHEGLPGVRIASGSLGQGLSVAIGTALAKKVDGDNRYVYCLMGDGELQEGQVWEAVMFAHHNKVDNLIAIVDWNGQQIDGPNDEVLTLGNLPAKWKSFGWKVINCDGNDMENLLSALNKAKRGCGKGLPTVILMRTAMGKGVDFMENNYKWHGIPPSDEDLKNALAQLPAKLGDY